MSMWTTVSRLVLRSGDRVSLVCLVMSPASMSSHLEKRARLLMPVRIRNPLTDIPKGQLLEDVERFAHQHNLVDALSYLSKGALVAQAPEDIDNIAELDEDDRQTLKTEKQHRWKHPKALYLTILLNSISAAIQGWDQTGSNGANLSFPQAFGIADIGPECAAAGTCERNSWIIGAINSSPYMTIAILLVF